MILAYLMEVFGPFQGWHLTVMILIAIAIPGLTLHIVVA